MKSVILTGFVIINSIIGRVLSAVTFSCSEMECCKA